MMQPFDKWMSRPGNNIFHPRSLPPPVDIQVCHSEWALDAEAWCEANRPTPIPSEISNNCRLIHYVFTPQWKWSDVGRAVAFVEWIFGSLFKAGYLQIWLSKGAKCIFWNRKRWFMEPEIRVDILDSLAQMRGFFNVFTSSRVHWLHREPQEVPLCRNWLQNTWRW